MKMATQTINLFYLALWLLGVLAMPCLSRPSSLFPSDAEAAELASDIREYDTLYPHHSKRLYIPLQLSPDAVLGALKLHSPNTMQQHTPEYFMGGEADAFFPQKRTTVEMGNPNDSFFPQVTQMKRKMFWSPLGYMPAAARAQHSPSSRSREDNSEAGTPGFRYG